MKDSVVINPNKLKGTVVVPPSKSAAHRAILCAALSSGTSVIKNIAESEDIKATISAVRALGAKVTVNDSILTVKGAEKKELADADIFCNESGSTLRFIIPIALAFGGKFTVSGKGRLMSRPLDDYFRIFDEKGISYEKYDDKITFSGKLKSGEYRLSGNVSSQYITGLIFGLSLLEDDSTIVITTPVESIGYIDMTIDMMKKFGVRIEKSEDYREYKIHTNQCFCATEMTIEGDYSQAAFFLVANELGSDIRVSGLDETSVQGDRGILDVIEKMREDVSVREINVSQIPDLVPILSVLAVKSKGITKITGAKRLRIKESDRLSAVTEELSKLGAKIKEFDDSLEIEGETTFNGGIVESHNDHRIAMSLAIAATVATNKITINGADSVKKSYKDFWEVFKELGGKIN